MEGNTQGLFTTISSLSLEHKGFSFIALTSQAWLSWQMMFLSSTGEQWFTCFLIPGMVTDRPVSV